MPGFDRSVKTDSNLDTPGIVMVVGVNGTARPPPASSPASWSPTAERRAGRRGHLPGRRRRPAADLGRARRRPHRARPRGGDPASIAFDAVKEGIEAGADVVLIDTAGRLHTKTGLMDELGKVKRVVRSTPRSTRCWCSTRRPGRTGLVQARVFAEVVDITGIVLTKLDGAGQGRHRRGRAAGAGRAGEAVGLGADDLGAVRSLECARGCVDRGVGAPLAGSDRGARDGCVLGRVPDVVRAPCVDLASWGVLCV